VAKSEMSGADGVVARMCAISSISWKFFGGHVLPCGSCVTSRHVGQMNEVVPLYASCVPTRSRHPKQNVCPQLSKCGARAPSSVYRSQQIPHSTLNPKNAMPPVCARELCRVPCQHALTRARKSLRWDLKKKKEEKEKEREKLMCARLLVAVLLAVLFFTAKRLV
jgi:hypothetical protein